MKSLGWTMQNNNQIPIVKIPLLFTFLPVQTLMKQLTKLNSPHSYRLTYLGPRWSDSVTFNKKYSNGGHYEFNDKKDSMTNNQFYKNQIFYRAFQGMNPTLNLQEQIIFQSRFQGGNLDCVVKVNQYQYDLFLRIDSNTRGHIFWFYFSVKNLRGKTIKLNICNFTKNDTHYSKGLNPFSYSSRDKIWNQNRSYNITFKQKKLRYQFLYERIKVRNFNQLSFQTTAKDDQQLRFAYCIPYNYSDLLKDINIYKNVAEIGTLGYTLTGVKIPLLMIGKNDQSNTKQVVIVTGRIHPSESNSSFVVNKFISFLCFSPQAKYLRQKLIFLIIPMLNPDGVILGNSRCGASGRDLNRQFLNKSKILFPQIFSLKNLIDKVSETHEIQLYLDFHGHSRKKNLFLFGPSYNITQPQYYKSRVLPKILSNISSIFRYYSCNYQIPPSKKSTARSVMINQYYIPYFFTVQSSLGYFHDFFQHKDIVFNISKWQQIGQHFVLSLKQYFEGIEQYLNFIQSKKREKRQLNQDIKSVLLNKKVQSKKQVNEVKIFKIYHQIKQLQLKRKQQKKQSNNFDNDSDSYDQKQNLQAQKMNQFSEMVTDFIQQQQKIIKNKIQLQEQKYGKKKTEQKKIKKIKRRRQNRFQAQYFQNYNQDDQIKQKTSKKQILNKIKRGLKSNQVKQVLSIQKRQVVTSQFKKLSRYSRQGQNLKNGQIRISTPHYLDQQINFVSIQKRSNNKMNVRMFNFSKMIQNPRSLRYNNRNQSIDLKNGSLTKVPSKQHQIKSMSMEYPKAKLNNVNFQIIEYEDDQQKIYQKIKHNIDDVKPVKGRIGFPSSFYRIKYHNSQRKKNQKKQDKRNIQYDQYQSIRYLNQRGNIQKLSNINFTLKDQDLTYQFQKITNKQQQKTNNFIQVKKFPVL